MAQIYGAFVLLSGYFGTVLLMLVFSTHLTSLPDIVVVCHAAGLPDAACQTAATNVAAQALMAVAMNVLVTFGFTRHSRQIGALESPRIDPFESSHGITLMFLSAVAAILILHNVRHEPPGLEGQHYRTAESAFVSIESLAWPLLLQFVFWTSQVRRKCVLASFLVAIAAISPFRNTAFTTLYFGALVPLGTLIFFGSSFSRRIRVFSLATIMAIMLFSLLIVAYQTENRGSIGTVPSQLGLIADRLTSRASTPFFQAALVDRVAESEQPLPDFLASIKQKFRLGSTNLNEFVFKIIYIGAGQTTTLYHGEAAANTRASPIFWDFAAPLGLVLVYFLLRSFCDVGILIAIALWRSSMGGLFDVLVALSLQLGFCLFLSYFHHQPSQKLAIAGETHENA